MEKRESGQLLPFVAVLMGLTALAMFWLGQLGAKAVKLANVESTAEIIAMAGKYGGIKMATTVADANGAELLEFERRLAELVDQPEVSVEIQKYGYNAKAATQGLTQ